MSRSARQLKILEIIAKRDINKQEELADLLKSHGFNVTQATVSRDIKDMGIVKTLAQDGKNYRYVAQQMNEEKSLDRYHRMFKNAVISIESSENIIVIKTEPGSANSAGALIDRLNFEEVLGTISGDDTIMVVASSRDKTELVIEKFQSLLD